MIHGTDVARVVFWTCLIGVAYEYAGYPLLIWLLSRLFGRERSLPEADASRLPSVTVLVCARDEEAVIEDRIINALALDYPPDRIELVVASDGSTDRTNAIVERWRDPRVRLVAFPESRGKARVLNDVVPSLASEVVVLSDANTFIEPGAVRRFAAWMSDARVGVVVGRLVLRGSEASRNMDGAYWRYETFLKQCETRLGALLGANGAIYAIRRERFQLLPPDTLIDDFVLPLLVRMRTGLSIVYDPASVAHEDIPEQMRAEFGRRSRIGAGGFSSLRVLWPLLVPVHGWTSLAFASHKVLRWLCPFLLIGAFASNLVLAGDPVYRWLLGAQSAFYVVAALGAVLPGRSLPVRVARMATLFVGVHAALLAGFWRWLTGPRTAAWDRTARGARTAPGLAREGDGPGRVQ